MKKLLHPKIKELQLKSAPITMSGMYVDANGNLQNVDFKIQTSEDNRVVKGYLATWGTKDQRYGEVMIKGCYAKSIAERGPDSVSKQKIAFLWDHYTSEPLGRFTKLKEDNYGLYFEADVDETDDGERALIRFRNGTVNQFSTGCIDMFDRMEYDAETDSILVLETKLMEGSAVVFGSDTNTHVVKSAQELINEKVEIMETTEDFINSIPRDKQLELRQLITKHITFAKSQSPEIKRQKALDLSVAEDVPFEVAGYKLNLAALAV